MEETDINIVDALRYLKAGYHLESKIEGKMVDFYYGEENVIVLEEGNRMVLNPYRFREIYQDTLFSLSDDSSSEEEVDPKKDQEYYSWRQ